MRDVAASVRARLFAWAKERGIQFQYVSMLYMQGGILSRLVASPFADKLILKGGFLLFAHSGSSGRTTKDIDFLGQGTSATFTKRNTELPEHPAAFSQEFANSERMRDLWAGFLTRTQLGDVTFAMVLETIRNRLEPFYKDLRNA